MAEKCKCTWNKNCKWRCVFEADDKEALLDTPQVVDDSYGDPTLHVWRWTHPTVTMCYKPKNMPCTSEVRLDKTRIYESHPHIWIEQCADLHMGVPLSYVEEILLRGPERECNPYDKCGLWYKVYLLLYRRKTGVEWSN